MTISPRSLARCGLVGGGWVVWKSRSAGNNRKASGHDAESEEWVCRGVVKDPIGAESSHRGREQADDGGRCGVESVEGGAFVVRIPGASRTRGYVCPVSDGSGSWSWKGEGCVFRGPLHVLRWYPRGETKRGTLAEAGARQHQGGSWKAKRGPRGYLSGFRGEVQRRGRCYRSRRYMYREPFWSGNELCVCAWEGFTETVRGDPQRCCGPADGIRESFLRLTTRSGQSLAVEVVLG